MGAMSFSVTGYQRLLMEYKMCGVDSSVRNGTLRFMSSGVDQNGKQAQSTHPFIYLMWAFSV